MIKVTVLGCGGSMGVPVIGGDWGQCDPENPRNRRTRPSLLLERDGYRVLIDATPEMREQLTTAGVRTIDAVILTHAHADHVHGIDDLRGIFYHRREPIDVYGAAETLDTVTTRFDYLFPNSVGQTDLYRPFLKPNLIDGPFSLGGIRFQPFEQDHHACMTLGFRIGSEFGYSTDVVRMSDTAFDTLDGIRYWIVDCVRRAPPHPTHATLETTLEWIRRVGPEMAWFTHMNQTMDYEALMAELPSGVEPAYDGLVIEVAD